MSDQINFISSQQNPIVQKLTENLIVKINEISQLNDYKAGLFNGLYTTEYLDQIDSIVLQELAILHGISIELPNKKIDGSWLCMDFNWGRLFVVSNIKLN